MSIPAPPSFETFFNNQQPPRQQSSDSTYDPNPKGHYNGNRLGPGDQPMNEEPRSISRQDSSSSLNRHQVHRRDGSNSSSSIKIRTVKKSSGELRQDSIPFDPVSSSTLISTAADSKNNIGETMFPGQGRQPPHSSYQQQQRQQQQPQHHYIPYAPSPGQQSYPGQWEGSAEQPGSAYWNGVYSTDPSPFSMSSTPQTDNGTTGSEPYLMDQQSPFTGASFNGHQNGNWGNEFLNQDSGNDQYAWGVENAALAVEENLAELERIISNSQAGSHAPSREGTPFQLENNQMPHQISGIAPDQSFAQVFDSAVTSRSTSPYQSSHMSNVISSPMNNSFQRNSQSPHPPSPFFNKPQSPPALIIPNQQHSPSPVLPPIVTSSEVTGAMQAQRQQGGAGLGGGAGGLFPPANPALEGLTGMAGISPIAPNADGPMIYIQPSTPISGLKDGRGVFDFKGVTQNQQGQSSQQQQIPQPTSHTLSRRSSAERLGQLAQQQQARQSFQDSANNWGNQNWSALRPAASRPRAKSDSQMGMTGAEFFQKQSLGNPSNAALMANQFSIPQNLSEEELRSAIDQWRLASSFAQAAETGTGSSTVDPRSLPGQDGLEMWNEFKMSEQFAQLQAQRDRLPSLRTDVAPNAGQVGPISPTSLAFYASMGINPQNMPSLGTASAPFYQSTFPEVHQVQWPQTAAASTFLMPDQGGLGPRRRSFAEGTNHPAAGAGTPGYGVEFTKPSPFGTLDPGKIRGSVPMGHRRAAKSEDLGRPGQGTGWGMGAGGSTADFLNSITAEDGLLLPPSRGRSHSRQSSASSARSASPALSVSSQGSSFSHASPRMDMPDGVQVPQMLNQGGSRKRVAKMKVTSVATEVASASRRTNDGVFHCPIPGCGSTFTRHFNLKGHLRSHNDERPYKCLYDGCPKATVGFARQHDCKRHMLLHEGLRPFECEGCGKKFARLDALTRHQQGQECAISHPLPVNPDGTPMSESQYKAYRAQQHNFQQAQAQIQAQAGLPFSAQPQQTGLGRRTSSFQGYLSGDDRSVMDDELGNGSGMEDYDRF